MTARMLKYRISLSQEQTTVSIREGAIIRAIGVQLPREICIWAEVPDETPVIARIFRVIGTGDEIPAAWGTYVGTAFDGPFVWHVYEVTS